MNTLPPATAEQAPTAIHRPRITPKPAGKSGKATLLAPTLVQDRQRVAEMRARDREQFLAGGGLQEPLQEPTPEDLEREDIRNLFGAPDWATFVGSADD